MKKTLLLLSMLCATLFAMAQVTTEPAVIPLGYKGKVVVTFNPAGTDMASKLRVTHIRELLLQKKVLGYVLLIGVLIQISIN